MFRQKKKYRVSELFDVVSGSTPSTSKAEYWSSDDLGIKWITPKDLSRLGTAYINKTERKISVKGLQSCSAHKIPAQSIIISSRAPIGYVAILNDEMACNQGCKALIPKNAKEIDPLYFYYLLLTSEKELNNLGSGSTFKELSKTKLEEFVIAVHDIKDQKDISQILEQADKARQQRKEANALTDQFLQSSFLSLFGDPVKNEKGWGVKRLDDVCDFENGDRSSNYPSGNEVVRSGVLFINSANINDFRFVPENPNFITEEKYASLRSGRCQRGDIIFTLRGNGLGKCCVFDGIYDEGFINAQLVILKSFRNINSYFLIGQLKEPRMFEQIWKLGSGSAQPQLSASQLKSLNIIVPPLSLQQQFAAIVAQAETLRKKQQENEQELEQLFQALLQKYFG
ncbi:restriction endonuclease subunit S [Lacibacter sp. H407]|uniref:restriction endonuclease subunit S n=1 Tax=Lacibacter sp. H407 TaxID=3133423 RepID=UPI0030BBA972